MTAIHQQTDEEEPQVYRVEAEGFMSGRCTHRVAKRLKLLLEEQGKNPTITPAVPGVEE